MALHLHDCTFFGPALPEPFVKLELEKHLRERQLLPRAEGAEGRTLQERWEVYRRKLRALGEQGGDLRVMSHVLAQLVECLGYASFECQDEVHTREGLEDGGWLMRGAGAVLRCWSVPLGTDLDAPNLRGRAYRYSPARVAQRVLLTQGERVGLLTDGEELRILICDPARPDSHIAIRLDRSGGWRATRQAPDSYRLVLALASPGGVAAIPDLTEAARLVQSTITKKLRLQARRAIEGFLQGLIDHPANSAVRAEWKDSDEIARILWSESLVVVYRLLFILKLESSADPARAFSFAATSLWRNTYSPNTALAPLVRKVLDHGADTGGFLEGALRALWRLFAKGMSSSELEVKPLGGMLFGANATAFLDPLCWGEQAVAHLLDALLWTPGDSRTERERVHYGALDVEDLGRVYEALLELEPGITKKAMCRLSRAQLEVIVPMVQGILYRTSTLALPEDNTLEESEHDGDDQDSGGEPHKGRTKGSNSKIQFVEEIAEGRFYLRVGLGRKTSGSYYTPHPFVRFLVQEILGPQLAERSPQDDPCPSRILELKVLDPAMGSGHFLVEVCRYLGEALYEACRLCDELAVQAEEQATKNVANAEQIRLLARAADFRKRVEDLPDPEDELVAYLPSRVPEGEESGLSQKRAEALCRRLIAVHCLYGVDKNPLAVELAKLSIWLESYAEGLPLTFMDHRLVFGDSLTGPFSDHLLTYPRSGERLADLFALGLTERLQETLQAALVHVHNLEASVGKTLADIEHKIATKARLDTALKPLKLLAAAWSGGIMLGGACNDSSYQMLAQAVARGNDAADLIVATNAQLSEMIALGANCLAFEFAFPEVFFPQNANRRGFDAVVGNPPWDKLRVERRDFLAVIDPSFMTGKEAAGVGDEHAILETVFESDSAARAYSKNIAREKRAALAQVPEGDLARKAALATSDPDLYRLFLLRSSSLLCDAGGSLGLLVGGGLAKVPADGPLRAWLFLTFGVSHFVHYNNLRQLFSGASSRISFVCLVAERGRVPEKVFVGLEYERFEDLLNIPSLPLAEVQNGLTVDGDITKVVHRASSGIVLKGRTNVLSALRACGISPGADIHRTNDKSALAKLSDFEPTSFDARQPDVLRRLLLSGAAPLYGGKSMRDYDPLPTGRAGKWVPAVTEVALLGDIRIARLSRAIRHYRFAWRATCGLVATNERSARAVLLPPGVVAGDSLRAEQKPSNRATTAALTAIGVFNSFALDFAARRVVQANLNLGVLKTIPWPDLGEIPCIIPHSVLRLSAVNNLYCELWREQLGDVWREPKARYTWPVLDGDDARWVVRAAIDAVVANAYGLDREQYVHVLSTFSHKSYSKAPGLFLATFDELRSIGLDAFTKKHDPYWDIALNNGLPKSVIELPILSKPKRAQQDLEPLFAWSGEPAKEDLSSAPAAQSEWGSRTPIDRHVLILSRVVDAHQRADRLATLGNVKAEKVVYLIEAHAGVNLDRAPIREAAGPADFPRLKKAIHRGERLHAFSVRSGLGGAGGIWSPGGGLRKRLKEYELIFVSEVQEIDRLIDLLVPMDSEQAEIVATLYACWNDLLARGYRPDDHEIIEEFHGWAEGKRRFDAPRLMKALDWMRKHDLVPTGRAKSTAVVQRKGRQQRTGSSARRRDDGSAYATIVRLLSERGVITSSDAQQATGLNAAEIRTYLERLVEEGLAVKEGQRRGTKYRKTEADA